MFIRINIGLILSYIIAGQIIAYKQEGYRLIKAIRKQNPLWGKNINDVIDAVGGYSSKQKVKITDRNNEQCYYNFIEGTM